MKVLKVIPSFVFRICFPLSVFLAGHLGSAFGQIIPANRLIPWAAGVTVGVPGGVDQYLPGGANQRTNLIDVTKAPYNADKTGATDASAAIQSAINAATPGSVVYLPAGTYRCDSTLAIGYSRDNITLRGS